jgi:hypothetical protein
MRRRASTKKNAQAREFAGRRSCGVRASRFRRRRSLSSLEPGMPGRPRRGHEGGGGTGWAGRVELGGMYLRPCAAREVRNGRYFPCLGGKRVTRFFVKKLVLLHKIGHIVAPLSVGIRDLLPPAAPWR